MYKDATVDELIDFLTMIRQEHGGGTKVVCEWDSSYSMINNYAIRDGVLIFDVSGYASSDVSAMGDRPDCDKRMRAYTCDECGKNPADEPGYLCPGCGAYKDHTQ